MYKVQNKQIIELNVDLSLKHMTRTCIISLYISQIIFQNYFMTNSNQQSVMMTFSSPKGTLPPKMAVEIMCGHQIRHNSIVFKPLLHQATSVLCRLVFSLWEISLLAWYLAGSEIFVCKLPPLPHQEFHWNRQTWVSCGRQHADMWDTYIIIHITWIQYYTIRLIQCTNKLSGLPP